MKTHRLICSNMVDPAQRPYQRWLVRKRIDRAANPQLTNRPLTAEGRNKGLTKKLSGISGVVASTILRWTPN